MIAEIDKVKNKYVIKLKKDIFEETQDTIEVDEIIYTPKFYSQILEKVIGPAPNKPLSNSDKEILRLALYKIIEKLQETPPEKLAYVVGETIASLELLINILSLDTGAITRHKDYILKVI